MKVLYVFSKDEVGGAPRSTYKLLKILNSEFNVTPVILTPKRTIFNVLADEDGFENYSSSYIYNGINTDAIEIKKLGKRFIQLILERKMKKQIKKNNLFSDVDLVHTSMSILDMGNTISNELKVPQVMHLRELLSSSWEFLSKKQIKKNNKFVTEFLAISNNVKKEWIDSGISKEKIELIYNGIDTSDIPIREHRAKLPLKILHIGTITPEKGQLDLINYIDELPLDIKKKIKIDFYGSIADQKYYEHILKKIEKNGLSMINIRGFNQEINSKINEYDIGIMSSINEPFGRVTVEYMLAKLCVIARNSGANPELIKNNYNGYLYSNKNEFLNILESLINHPSRIEDVGSNAFEYALENFSAKKNAEEIYKEYIKLLKIEEKK